MARRPRFTTPLTQARELLAQYVIRPLKIFKPRTRFLFGFGSLVVITTVLLFTNNGSSFAEDYHEGDIIRGSIVARGDITAVDISETERRRNAASRPRSASQRYES